MYILKDVRISKLRFGWKRQRTWPEYLGQLLDGWVGFLFVFDWFVLGGS